MKKKIFVSVIALLSVVVLLVIGTGCQHEYFKKVNKDGVFVDVYFKKAPTTGYHLYVYTTSTEKYEKHLTTKSNKLEYNFELNSSTTGATVKYCDNSGNVLDSWWKN